jgi:hypothetical protein
MDGRAVVTTRLSRTTMNSAVETIANVQRGLGRMVGASFESGSDRVLIAK